MNIGGQEEGKRKEERREGSREGAKGLKETWSMEGSNLVHTSWEKVTNYPSGSQGMFPRTYTAFLWDHIVPPSPFALICSSK